MYCWHAHYTVAQGELGRFRAWIDQRLTPLLREQTGIRSGLLLRGDRPGQFVLSTWWSDRADVEEFVSAPTFAQERDYLASLGAVVGSVETASHHPICPVPGDWSERPGQSTRAARIRSRRGH